MTLEEAIEKNKVIRIIAYSVSDYVEKHIKDVLIGILEKHNCRKLFAPIYTCIKELIINAVKANFKHIYFENYTPKNESFDMISYDMALQLFKLELSRQNADYLREIAIRNNLKSEIRFKVTGEILEIAIINPVEMTERERNNIARKLKDSRECYDIAEYFFKMEHDLMQEGAGLGLVLITIMLKSLGVEGNGFRIESENRTTTATIKIPLCPETVERYLGRLGSD
ncbi:MAG: hypothetical protein GY754_00760 [bacterium]|nr:hypothetical protein [bacterium]